MKKVEQITAYKAFGPDMVCRGFKYEVGKTYKHEGRVEACSAGFHACTLPFDCWNYYPLGSPIAKVKVAGKIGRNNEDSKVAAAEITIEATLDIGAWIKEQVGCVIALCKDAKEAFSTKDQTNAATTGYRANAATTGYRANAATTGEGANAATTGEGAIAASLGVDAKAKASAGGAIVLAEHDDNWKLINVRATKIGENGTKPDIWYVLKNGEFVEAE